MTADGVRILLVPGGGGSGPQHWHTYWQSKDAWIESVCQEDWTGGSREQWVDTLDRHVRSSDRPTVLVPHSLGNIVVCHWAASNHLSRVIGALLVAPADVDAEWAKEGSLYREFRPIPNAPLPFASKLVASSNDSFLSLSRAREFAAAWGARLHIVGALGHIGSDSNLQDWGEGRRLLNQLVADAARRA